MPAIIEEEKRMAAYFIFHNRIHNAEKMQEYISKALETLAPYHLEVLVLDENSQVVEGKGIHLRRDTMCRNGFGLLKP